MEQKDYNEKNIDKLWEKIDDLVKVVYELKGDFEGLRGRVYGGAALVSFITTVLIGAAVAIVTLIAK